MNNDTNLFLNTVQFTLNGIFFLKFSFLLSLFFLSSLSLFQISIFMVFFFCLGSFDVDGKLYILNFNVPQGTGPFFLSFLVVVIVIIVVVVCCFFRVFFLIFLWYPPAIIYLAQTLRVSAATSHLVLSSDIILSMSMRFDRIDINDNQIILILKKIIRHSFF